jgi:hypothetical protein
MDPRSSITAGVLLVAGVGTSVLSTAALGDALQNPGAEFGATDEARLVWSVVLQLLTAAGAVGIAVAIGSLIRLRSPGLAVGAVAFRAVEATFYAASALCLVVVSATGPAGFDAVMTVRDASNYVFGVVFFGIGAVLYSIGLYRQRLVPRWLIVWGVAGAVLIVGTAMVTLADGAPYAISGALSVLAVPIAAQELTLGAWLIVRGVRASRSAGRSEARPGVAAPS